MLPFPFWYQETPHIYTHTHTNAHIGLHGSAPTPPLHPLTYHRLYPWSAQWRLKPSSMTIPPLWLRLEYGNNNMATVNIESSINDLQLDLQMGKGQSFKCVVVQLGEPYANYIFFLIEVLSYNRWMIQSTLGLEAHVKVPTLAHWPVVTVAPESNLREKTQKYIEMVFGS